MSFAKQINGYGPDGRRRYFKGGGGGGGGSTFYANQDKLLGVQADIAEGMYNNIYLPNAPKAVASLGSMVDQANSGALATQARTQAAKDAGVALGTSAGDMMRTATGYGANFDPTTGRGADTVASWGLNAAKMRTGAMNQATSGAENQKWARNYDFYNSLSGVPTQSAASLGSAAAGFGGMGNAERGADMANAQGFGQAGASFAHALMKADGGLVRKPGAKKAKKGPGLHLASGGAVPSMQKLQPWRTRPTTVQSYEAPSAIESMATGAAPMLAAEGAKYGLKAAFLPTQAAAPVATAIPTAVGAGGGITAGAGGVTGATATGAGITGATVPAGATLGAELGTTAALGTEAAAGATAAAAGEAGLMGSLGAAGTGLMAAAPWLAGGVLATEMLGLTDFFADGGAVGRKDMTDGGRVNGPGTETSDDIPAWLSDEEYVLNAEAVKMVGKEKLDAINEAGLKRRGGSMGAVIEGKATRVKGGAPALASGGLMGVAMGAGVNQWDRLEAARRAEERASFDQQMRTSQAERDQKRLTDELETSGVARESSRTEGKVKALALADAKRAREIRDTIGAEEARTNDFIPPDVFNPDGTMKPDANWGQPRTRDYAPSEIEANVANALRGKGYGSEAAAYREAQHQKRLPKTLTLKEGEQILAQDPASGSLSLMVENKKDFNTPAEKRANLETQRNQAIQVGNRFLDANKTMMTQFGGDEQAIREEFTLNHSRKIGEFEVANGRPPNLAESEAMAREAIDSAKRKLVTTRITPKGEQGTPAAGVKPELWKAKR